MLQLLSAPLIAAFLYAGPTEPAHAVEASAPKRAALPTFSISALLDKPELRLGETHRVVAQFHGEAAEWNPFMTRFHADEYSRLTFWADEQWLWIKEEFDAPAADFFVRRRTDVAMTLANAKRHDRFELDIAVREVHAGRTWMEIVAVHRTEAQTPEGTVLHAIRALDMVEREGWALAINELERAMRPSLPGHVRRELQTLLEICERAKSR